MLRKIERGVQACRKNLKKLKPGVVVDETSIIWVKMFARPRSDDQNLVKVLKLRRKFNETLEDALTECDAMYICNLNSMTEQNFFTAKGGLTKSGQTQIWAEINHQLQLFDMDRSDFQPRKQCNLQRPKCLATSSRYF